MNSNPYVGILKMMQHEGTKMNPTSICIGEVVTPWPNMIIKIGELMLYKDDLKVADYLPSTLKQGNEVALLASEEGNTYFVLCRVVQG